VIRDKNDDNNNHYWGDQVKEDEMGGACWTHEIDEKLYKI